MFSHLSRLRPQHQLRNRRMHSDIIPISHCFAQTSGTRDLCNPRLATARRLAGLPWLSRLIIPSCTASSYLAIRPAVRVRQDLTLSRRKTLPHGSLRWIPPARRVSPARLWVQPPLIYLVLTHICHNYSYFPVIAPCSGARDCALPPRQRAPGKDPRRGGGQSR